MATIAILKKKKKYDNTVTKHVKKINTMSNSIFLHAKFNGRNIFLYLGPSLNSQSKKAVIAILKKNRKNTIYL